MSAGRRGMTVGRRHRGQGEGRRRGDGGRRRRRTTPAFFDEDDDDVVVDSHGVMSLQFLYLCRCLRSTWLVNVTVAC